MRYNYGLKCCLSFLETITKYSPGWDFYIFLEGYNSIDSVFTALFTWVECSPLKMLGTRTVQISLFRFGYMYVTFKLNIPNQNIWNPKGSRIGNVWPSLLFKSSFYYILFLWLIFCCHTISLIFHQIFFTSVFGNCILYSRLSVILTCISLLNFIIELHCKIMASNFLICYSVVCLLKLFSGKIQAFHPLWISPSCQSI